MSSGWNYVGSAEAALEQALGEQTFGDASQTLARAQAMATLASVEQARIANLIAWKQLQATRATGRDGGVDLLPLGSDDIGDEIEQGLGIA